jgi:phospholipid/cholesterol/gamma-HCH transport system ATP-binding protein
MATPTTFEIDEPRPLGPRNDSVIIFDRVTLAFDEKVILDGISFDVRAGHTKIILGASGAGKSITLKLALGLIRPDAGRIYVLGQRIDTMGERDLMGIRSHLGMVFQEGALFDSLTVGENVGYKLYEGTGLPLDHVRRRVEEVLGFVGLAEYIDRMPSAISGGQRRRVAIARAMCARPSLLLFDEPTTGLDPITALTVDAEIIKFRDLEGATSVLVTHQLRDAFYIATHTAERRASGLEIREALQSKIDEADFIMLRDGRIVFEGSAHELRSSTDPYLKAFLS